MQSPLNPYESPPVDDMEGPWSRWLRGLRALYALWVPFEWRFLRGEPSLYFGVLFFLDPRDDDVIHAALPSSDRSAARASRNAAEAARVLPGFLLEHPKLKPRLVHRRLIVRMIASYAEWKVDLAPRIEVSWTGAAALLDSWEAAARVESAESGELPQDEARNER